MGTAQDRLAFLDSMRFCAAALVLVQHLFEKRPGFIGDYFVPLGPGVAGVAIFFFISGYVIPMTTRSGFVPMTFAVRRIFRIYPLFLAAIVLITIAGATGLLPQWGYMYSAPVGTWLANLLLVQDFAGVRPFLGVSWTLAIELIWYALFAASLWLWRERAADLLDLLVPASLVTLAVASLAFDVRLPLGRPTMVYAAVIGFQSWRFLEGQIDIRRLLRSIAVFAVVALATTYVSFGIFSHERLTLAQALGPWTLGTVVFLVCVMYRPVREARILNSGLLPMLGAMSYSTYLLHPVALATARTYSAFEYQVPVVVALTLVLSWVGYNWVERPGIAIGRAVVRSVRPALVTANGA